MKTKSFQEFVNENMPTNGFSPTSAWGLSPLDGVSNGSNVPYDDQLISNPWDRHVNDTRYGINKGSTIMTTLFNTNAFGNTYNDITEMTENITEISIVNIEKNEKFLIDLRLKFYYYEDLQFMSIKNIGGIEDIIFKSTLYRYQEFRNINIRNKLNGLFIKLINKWFKPVINFKYQAEQEVRVYDMLGRCIVIPVKSVIEVKKIINKNNGTDAEILYNGDIYTIKNNDYYFFKWMFSPIEKKHFYL